LKKTVLFLVYFNMRDITLTYNNKLMYNQWLESMIGDDVLSKLYIVPTPIGNLKDITLRSIEALKEADVIAAEDTRVTLKLLNHLNIKKSLTSYHQHNEKNKSDFIIDKLNEGQTVAVVSDAGTPGISDPGSVIIKRCIEEGIEFEVLPGATAFTTALVYSGLPTESFSFRGFIPRDNKGKKALIQEVKENRETLIFYESPHRLIGGLEFLKENLGNRRIAICRELTKMYEEILRMRIDEAIEYYSNERKPKGEYVLVVEGKTQEEIEEENKQVWEDLTIEEHIKVHIENGIRKKDAVKQVAKERNLPKSEVYKYSLEI